MDGGGDGSRGSTTRPLTIPPRQLQAKYKHARDFGITGPYNPANARAFAAAIQAHVAAPTTRAIQGIFRGTIPVVYYVDQSTGLMVMTDTAGSYLSGWALNRVRVKVLGGG